MLEFDVSLLQIQVFLAVAEQHSFSKAAEQVNLEQSTVSRRIGVLERELGVRLFRREERPVGLTEAGELLYSRWRPLLAAFEQYVQVLERFQDNWGQPPAGMHGGFPQCAQRYAGGAQRTAAPAAGGRPVL